MDELNKTDFEKMIKRINKPLNTPDVNQEAIIGQMRLYIHYLKKNGIEARNLTIWNAMLKYLAETKKNLNCRHKGLLFFGNVGIGKSFAVETIANLKGYKIYESKSLSKMFLLNEEVFWEKIDTHNTIVIDDIGDEITINNYGTKTEAIGEAITHRYKLFESHCVKTIFASNYCVEDIIGRYGDRIFSRLGGMCECVNIENGDDLRINNGE